MFCVFSKKFKEKKETSSYYNICHDRCSFLLHLQNFRGLSFPTISSVGPNAAIIHYAPQAETCAEFNPESIYLFDSGAQVRALTL